MKILLVYGNTYEFLSPPPVGISLLTKPLQNAGHKVHVLDFMKVKDTDALLMSALKEHKPDIIGMSALLTTTMPKMEETIIALKEAGLRDQVKIMAGGAPVTQDFVDKIGADAYGANAAAASDKAKALLA